jgi:DNA polymerase-3 subunit gamma/tau
MVDQEVYFQVTDLVKHRDAKGALDLVENLLGQGHDMKDFLSGLLEHFRNLLVVKTTGSTQLLEVSDIYKKKYQAEAVSFSVADLLRFQRHINGTEAALRYAIQPRFRLEADLVQLVSFPRAAEIAGVIEGIEELKKKLNDSTRVPGSQAKPFSSLGAKPELRRSEASISDSLPAAGLSEAEVRSRWDEVLAEVRRQRISLSAVLEAGVLSSVKGNIVQVAFADDFQVSHIQRNREFLSGLISKVFDTTARIEATADRHTGTAMDSMRAHRSADQSDSSEEHPVIAALKRELGAEPLE